MLWPRILSPVREWLARLRSNVAAFPALPTELPSGAAFVPLPFHPAARIAVHRHDQFVSPWIAAGHIWEPVETRLIQHCAPKACWFLDVGANIGWFSCLAQLYMPPGALVAAIEPDPENLSLLRHTLAQPQFRNILRLELAASDRSGTALLHPSPENRGDHRIADPPPSALNPIPVRVEPLDRIFEGRLSGPGIIKMDIQGHEPEALNGMRNILADRRCDPLVIVEVWPSTIERRLGNWRILFQQLQEFDRAALLEEDPPEITVFGSLADICQEIEARWSKRGHNPDWYASAVLYRTGSAWAGRTADLDTSRNPLCTRTPG